MAGRPPTSAAERFAEKCKPGENGCIEWTGGTTRNGYGLFHTGPGKRMTLAHRYAYQQAKGSIPDGMENCHRCDNRRCVNVEHLFVGTRGDNMQDAKTKGRLGGPRPNHRGEKHSQATLTNGQVLQIRQMAARGLRFRAIGSVIPASYMTLYRVINRLTWRHI